MAGTVHIPWYATGFRGDRLERALVEVTPTCLRYGATSYAVHRSRDDRYKMLQIVGFDDKGDWERWWEGPDMTRFRTVTSSWYQVPVLYVWHDCVAQGALPANANGGGGHKAPSHAGAAR